jgi:proteasome lid subunit RPN8/RPN11
MSFPRDGTSAFWMSELDCLRAQQIAEARGDRVTAIYHSHVGAGAYFSELDQAYAQQEGFPFPAADHLVIAVLDGRVSEVAAFQRDPASGAFRGRAVSPCLP